MEPEKKGRGGGTGVFMPPSVTAALSRGPAGSTAQQQQARPGARRPPGRGASSHAADNMSPVNTPRSCASRSNSFSSTSSSTCAASAVPGKPPHLAANPHTGTRPGSSNRPHTAQQYCDRSVMGPGAAEAGAPGPAQCRYGRFSLDDSSARLVTSSQTPHFACRNSTPAGAGAVWAPGTDLCNSLSMPPALDCMIAAAAAQEAPAPMVQEAPAPMVQDSWASTVSGDMCMLPPGGDAAALLANAEALQAMQNDPESQLLLAQQQEQELLTQQHQQQRQLLRAQLGLLPAAPQQQCAGQMAFDSSPLLAQVQCSSLAAPRNPASRRASFGPVIDLSQTGRACSLPPVGLQVPQLLPSTSPLMGSGVAFCGANEADAALGAEIDDALRRLLLLRSEVEVSKAQARAARSSCGNSGLYGAPGPTVSRLAATAQQLYQPSNPMAAADALSSALYASSAATPAAGPAGGANLSAAQLAAVSVTAGPRTSFSGLTPVVDASGGGFSFAPQRLHASAGAAVMGGFSGGAAVGHSLGQQPAPEEVSLADLLAYGMPPQSPVGTQAGPAMPQAALQQELQLLALRQAAVSTVGQGCSPAGAQMALPLLSQPR